MSTELSPASTQDAREKQLIRLAVDLAEKQLREGTASSAVITHYLKMGSVREKMEREKLESENRLARAKTKSIEMADSAEQKYLEAIAAMKMYQGVRDEE